MGVNTSDDIFKKLQEHTSSVSGMDDVLARSNCPIPYIPMYEMAKNLANYKDSVQRAFDEYQVWAKQNYDN